MGKLTGKHVDMMRNGVLPPSSRSLGVPESFSEAPLGITVSVADSFVMYTRGIMCGFMTCSEVTVVNGALPFELGARDLA